MFGKDKKVSDFVDTWWWRGLRVLYGILIVITYVWISSDSGIFAHTDSLGGLILGLVSLLFIILLVIFGALSLRTVAYYIIEGSSGATKKSLKYTAVALFFMAITFFGGLFIESQVFDSDRNISSSPPSLPEPPLPQHPSF